MLTACRAAWPTLPPPPTLVGERRCRLCPDVRPLRGCCALQTEGVEDNEPLLASCPVTLLMVEKNSHERMLTAPNHYSEADLDVSQPGELFLFAEHLCVEVTIFNMSVMTCATLTDVLALLRVAPGVIEVQAEARSFRIAVPLHQFDAVCARQALTCAPSPSLAHATLARGHWLLREAARRTTGSAESRGLPATCTNRPADVR